MNMPLAEFLEAPTIAGLAENWAIRTKPGGDFALAKEFLSTTSSRQIQFGLKLHVVSVSGAC